MIIDILLFILFFLGSVTCQFILFYRDEIGTSKLAEKSGVDAILYLLAMSFVIISIYLFGKLLDVQWIEFHKVIAREDDAGILLFLINAGKLLLLFALLPFVYGGSEMLARKYGKLKIATN